MAPSVSPARIAIVAGSGALPRLLAEGVTRARATPPLIVRFPDTSLDWAAGMAVIEARFETLGALFASLANGGCTEVVFAGGMRRPNPDPRLFDAKTREIAPRLFARLGQGDATVLSAVAEVFEAEGLTVLGAHEVLPGLLATRGALGRIAPGAGDLADILRAGQIVETLGALDIGQAAVVAQGLCLGLETLQGTDRLLDYVAVDAATLRAGPKGAKGVLFKGPKPAQDLRMDMPAIGPATLRRVAAAGLAGLAVVAGAVLMLGPDAVRAEADRLGLFVYGVGGPDDLPPDSAG